MEELKPKGAPKRKTQISILIDNITGLFETYIRILELEVKIRVADAVAILIVFLMVTLFLALTLVFASIGLAFYLDYAFDLPVHAGFLLVALLYLLLFIGMFFSRKLIREQFNKVIDLHEKD